MCRCLKIDYILKALLGCVLCGYLFASGVLASDQAQAEFTEETMLMFVGETEPVVTVASRYPESPTTAPAMVRVVDREQIERNGYRTLAELLRDQPGFFMVEGGRGTVPTLRGLRDSILLLYDGVPLSTDVTKSFYVLDRELSLAAVERVEILRGAGSVLWGPDAFSGVVNIVPMSGHLKAETELRGEIGNQEVLGGGLTFGIARRNWEAFFAASGSQEMLHTPDLNIDPSATDLPGALDRSRYEEVVGTLNVGDWLHLSGRWSDFERHYTMENGFEDVRWYGKKSSPARFLKASASKVYGPSHFTLTGYYQQTDYQVIDSDVERSQRNTVTHAELLWDRRVLSRGLVTIGASWRHNNVEDAFVRDGFLPDFLIPDEPLWVPQIEQADFSSELVSVFSQFRYKLGKGEWWAGLRLDDHSQYSKTLSHSLGFQYPMGKTLYFKANYGTAFRSPYSSQLFNDQKFDPESVQTASVQMTWEPTSDRSLETTLFYSRIQDHRAEDPYGGLSLPSDRKIYGVELAGQAQLISSLTLNAGLSLINVSGGEEKFRAIAYTFARPDSTVDVYEEWDEPFEQSPSWLANLALRWDISDDHSLTVGGRIGGNYDYSYQKGAVEGSYDTPLVIDVSYRRPGFFRGKDQLIVRATNLFDKDYKQPDIYGPVDGLPLQVTLEWRLRF